MRILVWTLVVLMAGTTFQPARGGDKWWNRFGIGKKPSQSSQASPNAAVGESDEPPLAPPLPTPGIAADSRSRTAATPAPESVRMINSKHIVIKYKVKHADPSAVSDVELWITRDGQHWLQDKSGTQPQMPYHAVVEEEGTYGFILAPKNGLGDANEPPKSGDPAQFWIEVDLTKPVVVVTSVQSGDGGKTAVIKWSATDKNLGPRPITLHYTDKNGDWQLIATTLENTGSYTWRLTSGLPSAFRVRVEATDLAGNAGTAETAKPVAMGTAKPEVTEIQISPGN